MTRPTSITALALASLLALAGCAGGSEDTTGGATPEVTAGTSAATASAAVSASASASAAAGAGTSAEHNDADTMFAQMMIAHHEQAVTMSQTLLAKDDVPEKVRELAEGVIAAQGPEIEQMQQMLEAWGEPTSMEHGGMDHGSMGSGSGAGMDGMMSEEDTTALEEAQSVEAARLYLQQMTVHHEGAIEMARGEVTNGTNPEAVELAEDVVAAQEAEITEMDQLLQGLTSQS